MSSKLGRLNPTKTILLICDMQEKLAKSVSRFENIVETSGRIIDASKLFGIPKLVTEHYPKGLGRTIPELKAKLTDAVFVDKTQFSMCTTEVKAEIDKIRPDYESIILCGIEAHACVLSTCLDFLAANKEVHVVTDTVSSRSLVDRKYALQRMAQSGAFLTTSESVMFQLCKDAMHPNFKKIQNLIRTVPSISNFSDM